MLLLIAAVYACIELKGNFPKGSEPRELLKHWHFMLGLAVFGLVWLRLLARLIYPAPRASTAAPLWERLAAHVTHIALYVLMIGLPLLGWATLSAAGKPTPFFGIELPALLSADRGLAGQLKEVHELFGQVGYWLIGLHAVAALFHQFVRRDDVLRRMLPQRHSL